MALNHRERKSYYYCFQLGDASQTLPHQFPFQVLLCLAQWAPNLDVHQIHQGEGSQVT